MWYDWMSCCYVAIYTASRYWYNVIYAGYAPIVIYWLMYWPKNDNRKTDKEDCYNSQRKGK